MLNVITGRLQPDSGEVEIGTTVKIGYFTQENTELDPKMKVIDYIKEIAEYLETPEGKITATKMLERFLFTSSMQYTEIGRLSGGEKRRLYLLKVLMEAPNVLVLDEPTNDLDIQTLTILENYLETFDGIVITVSHDRYFLDRIATRIFAFEGNGIIKQYEGNFSDYKERVGEQQIKIEGVTKEKAKATDKKAGKPRLGEEKLKFTYKEQKEYNEIDEIISNLETEIEKTEEEIGTSATDFVKLNELMKKKTALEEDLEYRMERWVYLNDLAEKIEEQKNK